MARARGIADPHNREGTYWKQGLRILGRRDFPHPFAPINGWHLNVSSQKPGNSVWEVARLFLKLGTIAFGGPAAHIAMMQDEVCRQRGWVSEQRFLKALVSQSNPHSIAFTYLVFPKKVYIWDEHGKS